MSEISYDSSFGKEWQKLYEELGYLTKETCIEHGLWQESPKSGAQNTAWSRFRKKHPNHNIPAEESGDDEECAPMSDYHFALTNLDEQDKLIKKSVLAYLMWHSGYVFSKSTALASERADTVDDLSIGNEVNPGSDRLIRERGIHNGADEKRILATKSLHTQREHSKQINKNIINFYLDVEAIDSDLIIPQDYDSDDMSYTTPEELGEVGWTFESYNDLRDSYKSLARHLVYDPLTVMLMFRYLQDHFIHIALPDLREGSTFHTVQPQWLIVGLPPSRNRSIGDTFLKYDAGHTVKVCGQVIEVGESLLAYIEVAFRCVSVNKDTRTPCNHIVLIPQNTEEGTLAKPSECRVCSGKQFAKLDSQRSKTEPMQRIQIQEDVENGEQEAITVELRGSLVGTVSPGSTAAVTGVLRLEALAKGSAYNIQYLFGQSIEQLKAEATNQELSEEDIETIEQYRRENNTLEERLSSFTHAWAGDLRVSQAIKRAILLQACGAPVSTKLGRRSALHLLLVGDPGTAKTMLLKYAGRFAKGSRYIDASNASQAGLTGACSQIEDLYTGKKRWAIIPGELALTHQDAICSVDEFNLYKGDKGDFNNALESGEITISKIVKATLATKCSVLAGANPSAGDRKRFRKTDEEGNSYSYANQLGMEFPQLQRFDAIYTLTDEADEDEDYMIAMAMLGESEHSGVEVDMDFIRRYIAYSKTFTPILSTEVKKRIAKDHAAKRQENIKNNSDNLHSHRQVASRMRFTIAMARFDLSNIVTIEHMFAVEEILAESLAENDPGALNGEPDKESKLQAKRNSIKKIILDMYNNLEGTAKSKPQSFKTIDSFITFSNESIDKKSLLLLLDTLPLHGDEKTGWFYDESKEAL